MLSEVGSEISSGVNSGVGGGVSNEISRGVNSEVSSEVNSGVTGGPVIIRRQLDKICISEKDMHIRKSAAPRHKKRELRQQFSQFYGNKKPATSYFSRQLPTKYHRR